MAIRTAYEVVMPYHLHMPSYFLGTFTEYPNLLGESGWSREDLQRFGYLTNNNYDEAEKQYKAYKRNSLIGICTLVFSGGILIIVYLIFLIMAYRNVARFYKALGRNEDETALFNALGVLAYFHLKEKMKEELKGIR